MDGAVVKPGVATEEQRAALRRMLEQCDKPTGYLIPTIKKSKPSKGILRKWWMRFRKKLLLLKGL